MRRKPVGTAAGALLTGMLLSGCGFGRMYYEGSAAYAPPPAPASVAYSQVPGWVAQSPRMVPSAYQPVTQASAAMPKTELAPGTMEVTTSLQVVNGANAGAGATPMLMISMPAVKILVPVNSVYPNAPSTSLAECTTSNGCCGTESGACRTSSLNTQTAPAVAPPPPAVPSAPAVSPSMQPIQPAVQTAPAPASTGAVQHLPPFTPPGPAAIGHAAAKGVENTAVPAPNWPKSNETNSSTVTNETTNPPPPPIPRQPTGAPLGQ